MKRVGDVVAGLDGQVKGYLVAVGASLVKAAPGTLYYCSEPGEKLNITKVLGRGGFGVVRLCEYHGKPDENYALKTVKTKGMSESELENQLKEEQALAMIHHPMVIQLHAVFDGIEKRHLLLDLVGGGQRHTRVQRIRTLGCFVCRALLAG